MRQLHSRIPFKLHHPLRQKRSIINTISESRMKRVCAGTSTTSFLLLICLSMAAEHNSDATKAVGVSDDEHCRFNLDDLKSRCKDAIIHESVDEYCLLSIIRVRTTCPKDIVLNEAPYYFSPYVDSLLKKAGQEPYPPNSSDLV